MNAIRITLILLLSCLSPFVYSNQIIGKVVGVSDGDTITLLTDQKQRIKVRLSEIDAPEKNQAWGQNAKRVLSNLIYSRSIVVQSAGEDRYGRVLGTIYIGEVNINKEMVETGNAWAYTQYVSDQSYFTLQKNAKSRKAGLWSLPEEQIIAPWEWRRKNH